MKMHNPPHPGKIIKGLWLEPMGVSITHAAKAIGVSRKLLSNIINGREPFDHLPMTMILLAIDTMKPTG